MVNQSWGTAVSNSLVVAWCHLCDGQRYCRRRSSTSAVQSWVSVTSADKNDKVNKTSRASI